jgi:glycosyltransferase involved in cell wall biosynthesis
MMMNPQSAIPQRIKVCHIAHGDLWAGAEVQLATLLEVMRDDPALDLSVILLNDGRLASEIRSLHIPVTVLSEEHQNSLGLFMKMIGYLKEKRPNIVHTHKYKDNILGAGAAAVAGVPIVVRIVHGITEPFRGTAYVKMMGYEFIDRLVTSARVKKLIAVSSNIGVALERLYGSGKVAQIHNGINLEKLKPSRDRKKVRDELGVETDDQVVGTVGRLTSVKGHEVLLRAADSLMKKIGNIKLLIVGDGPLMPRLKTVAHELGIEKKVILAGHRGDVYDFLNCMDVFTLPSIHEGIPMVLLEALALRRPVVASRVGGIPEVVEDGVSGILVAPHSATELQQGIERVLQDSTYANRLAQAGRLRVEEEFTATAMARRTADLYKSLVRSREELAAIGP